MNGFKHRDVHERILVWVKGTGISGAQGSSMSMVIEYPLTIGRARFPV